MELENTMEISCATLLKYEINTEPLRIILFPIWFDRTSNRDKVYTIPWNNSTFEV